MLRSAGGTVCVNAGRGVFSALSWLGALMRAMMCSASVICRFCTFSRSASWMLAGLLSAVGRRAASPRRRRECARRRLHHEDHPDLSGDRIRHRDLERRRSLDSALPQSLADGEDLRLLGEFRVRRHRRVRRIVGNERRKVAIGDAAQARAVAPAGPGRLSRARVRGR